LKAEAGGELAHGFGKMLRNIGTKDIALQHIIGGDFENDKIPTYWNTGFHGTFNGEDKQKNGKCDHIRLGCHRPDIVLEPVARFSQRSTLR
jgi:hypothetical protein